MDVQADTSTSSSPAPGRRLRRRAPARQSGRYRVLLLEAGPPDTQPLDPHPARLRQDLRRSGGELEVRDRPQPQIGNRRLYLPRGKTLGGSSSINGMVYIRGNHARLRRMAPARLRRLGLGLRPARSSRKPKTRPAAPTIPRRRRPVAGIRPVRARRTARRRAAGLRAGRHPGQSRFQRRRPGRLRLLPDHHQQQAPLERGQRPTSPTRRQI